MKTKRAEDILRPLDRFVRGAFYWNSDGSDSLLELFDRKLDRLRVLSRLLLDELLLLGRQLDPDDLFVASSWQAPSLGV